MDYTLQTPEERISLVKEILDEATFTTEKYLEILSDYIIFAMNKEEKKKKEILTENRLITVNKRECSLQELTDKFENGEDRGLQSYNQ